jgi:hypothetical protein
MNRQALLAAALAVVTIGAPVLARADLAADQAALDNATKQLKTDQQSGLSAAQLDADQAAINAAQAKVNADNLAARLTTDQAAADLAAKQLKTDQSINAPAAIITADQGVVNAAQAKVSADKAALAGANNPTGENPYGCWKRETATAKMKFSQPDKLCFVAGAFGIPFRAQLSGKKDVFGGVSGDVFAGMNISWGNTASVTLLVYAGYLPTFNTTNSQTSTTTGQTANNTGNTSGTGGALDFGVGISTPILDLTTNQKMNIGVVIGTDVTGSSNRYSYNGKPYLALLLGSNF